MPNNLYGGFWPCNEATARVTRYEVVTAYATDLFAGDLVTLVTAGVVEAVTAGGAPLILGAIKQVSYVQNGRRIFANHLPASTAYTPTARGSRNASYVWVFDDPNTEYWACIASHANTDTKAKVYAAVGSNMDIVATAGNSVYQRSGYTLDGNPIAGTAQMRISGVRRVAGRDETTTANLQLSCRINEGFHPFHSAAGI